MSVCLLAIAVTVGLLLGLVVFRKENPADVVDRYLNYDVPRYITESTNEEMRVFLSNYAGEKENWRIESFLMRMPEVRNALYISKEKALELTKEMAKYDPALKQALVGVVGNPMPAAITVRVKNTNDRKTIADRLKSDPQVSGVVSEDLKTGEKEIKYRTVRSVNLTDMKYKTAIEGDTAKVTVVGGNISVENDKGAKAKQPVMEYCRIAVSSIYSIPTIFELGKYNGKWVIYHEKWLARISHLKKEGFSPCIA